MEVSDSKKDKNLKQLRELLYEGYYYDVTEWIKKHPGGRIIEFYTENGEDATNAIKQFHKRSTKKVMSIMNCLKKRPADPKAEAKSGESHKRNDALTKDFLQLYKEVDDEGLFKPSPSHIIYRISELLLFYLIGLALIKFTSISCCTVIGILFLSLFQGRCGWLMHEAGHHALFGKPNLDRFVQSIIYGFGDGMSASWWSSQHNRHHAMPQRLQRDVDLETMPFLAFHAKVVKKSKEGKGFFVQNQAVLFLAIDTFLVAFFWKLFLHPKYAFKKGKYSDLFFMAMHYYFVAYQIGFFYYCITIWLASVYIFGNFSLSHTHLPVTTNSEHWVDYAFTHTADIDPSWWCDWWMGYLNFQIEHHLFPTMPQFRHKIIANRVRKLAEKHGLKYQTYSYTEALKKTFMNLWNVSNELKYTQ